MKRWNMKVEESSDAAGAAAGSASNRSQSRAPAGHDRSGQDDGWKQVKPRKKKAAKGDEPDPVISLCPSAWAIPIKSDSDFQPGVSCVYQITTKASLQELAMKCIHMTVGVMAVAPFKVEVGYSPPQQLTLPFTVEHGARRSKAHLNVWLYQLAAELIEPVAPPQPVSIEITGTASASCVLSASIDVSECSDAVVEAALAKPQQARQLIASMLPKELAEEQLLDVFRTVRTSRRWLSTLLRIKETATDRYLQLSGLGNLWFNTPRELTEATRMVWLKDGSVPPQPLTLEEARARILLLENPLGLVAKPNPQGGPWSFAIRVRTSQYIKAQAALSIDTRETFYVQGVPPSLSETDMQTVLDNGDWPATIVAGSRRVWRNRASMAIKAKLNIISRKSHARAHTLPAKAVRDKDESQVEATNWSSALDGRYKPTTPVTGDRAASVRPQAQQQPRPRSRERRQEDVSTDATQQQADGTTQWWRGAQWVMNNGRWNRTPEPPRNEDLLGLHYNNDDAADVAMGGTEDSTRKRLTFAPNEASNAD
eukprot:2798724-Amphidinium_carterae.1